MEDEEPNIRFQIYKWENSITSSKQSLLNNAQKAKESDQVRKECICQAGYTQTETLLSLISIEVVKYLKETK